MTENKIGLEKMMELLSGAIADEKTYRANGKILNDYGKGMVDTMGKCLGHAKRLLAEERAQKPTASEGLAEAMKELRAWADTEHIYVDPNTDYDSHDLSEKGGYKNGVFRAVKKIEEILAKFTGGDKAKGDK